MMRGIGTRIELHDAGRTPLQDSSVIFKLVSELLFSKINYSTASRVELKVVRLTFSFSPAPATLDVEVSGVVPTLGQHYAADGDCDGDANAFPISQLIETVSQEIDEHKTSMRCMMLAEAMRACDA